MTNIVVVLDIGEFSCKIGYGSENEPRITFLNLVGTPKYVNIEMGFANKEAYFVGDEVTESMGLYKLHRPLYLGHIHDWVMFEQVIDYCFYALKVDPSTVNVLYTYHPYMSKEEIEKLLSLFFEKYQVAGFYPVLDSLLTMYSGGFQTGLCVEMGASSIRIIPIYQSFKLEHAIQVIEIGGTVLDQFMEQELKSVGFDATTSVQKELIRVLKERACFVSLDYQQDLENKEKHRKEFKLPDQSILILDEQRFKIPELLFNPSLFNIEQKPLHEAIYDSIMACDMDIRTELINNIFISGGCSLFPQLEYRLQQELQMKLIEEGKQMRKPRIIAPKMRIFSCWVGGSILSYIPEFQGSWITRTQYYNKDYNLPL